MRYEDLERLQDIKYEMMSKLNTRKYKVGIRKKNEHDE